jgi:cell division protein FtsL
LRIERILHPRFAWVFFFFALLYFLGAMSVSILSVRADHEMARNRDEILNQKKLLKSLEVEEAMLTREARVREYSRTHGLKRVPPATVVYIP